MVAQDVRQRLVSASRVDYCNSSLAGLRAIALAPLQMVFNVATSYTADLRPHDHVTLVQRSLHWLPVHQCIQHMLCILMYGAAHEYAPDYITNLVTLTSATSGRSHLHSVDSLTFDIPRTRTRMGDHVLSVADPRAWNALPADIRCAVSLDTFKKRLKSHLFSAVYTSYKVFFYFSNCLMLCILHVCTVIFVQCWPHLC